MDKSEKLHKGKCPECGHRGVYKGSRWACPKCTRINYLKKKNLSSPVYPNMGDTASFKSVK